MRFFYNFRDGFGRLFQRLLLCTGHRFLQHKQEFDVPLRACDRRKINIQHMKPGLQRKFNSAKKHLPVCLLLAHHAVFADLSPPCFKLRLHKNHRACIFTQASKHLRQD